MRDTFQYKCEVIASKCKEFFEKNMQIMLKYLK